MSLENRGFLLKGTTRKIANQEGGFLSFFRPLTTAGLPLIKGALTPLAKSVLIPFGLTRAASATDIQYTLFKRKFLDHNDFKCNDFKQQ